MATISAANFEALTDSICAQYAAVSAALGDYETSGSAAYGAQQNLGRILDLDDAQQVLALLPSGQGMPTRLSAIVAFAERYRGFLTALQGHVGGSIDAYLTAQGILLGQECAQVLRQMGYSLTPANVFSAAITDGATFSASGAGAGTYTAGTSIDGTLYAGNTANLVLTHVQGSSAGTYTVTLTLAAGGTQTETRAVPGSTASGTAYTLGGGAVYVGVSDITYSGGQASDACEIQFPRLRAATL